MKEKIKRIVEIILIVTFLIAILLVVRNQAKWIKWNYEYLNNTKQKIEFVCPWISKAITNDTFFTIAIGRNVLENGFTNDEVLTFHDNLKFPHSGVFDVMLNMIYEVGSFRRNIHLYDLYGNSNISEFSRNMLSKYEKFKGSYCI